MDFILEELLKSWKECRTVNGIRVLSVMLDDDELQVLMSEKLPYPVDGYRRRNCNHFPWAAYCEHNGVRYDVCLTQEQFEKMVMEGKENEEKSA